MTKSSKKLKDMKEREYYDKKKKVFVSWGKYKDRYISKRTCRFWKRGDKND